MLPRQTAQGRQPIRRCRRSVPASRVRARWPRRCRPWPVSYTHLDVYKRQAPSSPRPPIEPCARSRPFSLPDCARRSTTCCSTLQDSRRRRSCAASWTRSTPPPRSVASCCSPTHGKTASPAFAECIRWRFTFGEARGRSPPGANSASTFAPSASTACNMRIASKSNSRPGRVKLWPTICAGFVANRAEISQRQPSCV